MNTHLAVLSFVFFFGCLIIVNGYGHMNEDEENESPSTEDLPASFSFKLNLGNENIGNVFDNVVPYSQRQLLSETWNEKQLIFSLSNYSWTQNFESNIGSTPWIQEACIKKLQTFAFWKNFLPLLEEKYGKNLNIEHAQLEISHALDPRPPVVPQYCAKGRHIATIFLNKYWPKNNYGQVSFYAEMANKNLSSEARLEILETVHPRGGRAVVYPSCQTNVFHPPTASFFKHMTFLNVWFSESDANSEPIENLLSKTAIDEGELREDSFSNFTFKNPPNVDLSKALKRTFFDSTGKKGLYFYDDVFTTEELRAWRSHLLRNSNVGLNKYDKSSLEDNDNVAFVSLYKVASFIKTDMWKRVYDQIKFISKEDGWYPYDVALNYVRSSDHTRVHPDSELHQYEYTYLLYLTEGIESKHMGETIWVEKTKKPKDGITKFTGLGGEEYEPHAAVKPKFGRAAVFYNNVEHSARPLNTEYLGDRYSFAVKVGKSKRNAYVKLCYETFEAIETENKKLIALNSQLQQGMHDEGKGSKLTVDGLVKIHEKFLKMRAERMKKGHEQMQNMLSQPFDDFEMTSTKL